ncbi:MAG: hypothetical protein CVV45_17320 [Spirochaetae bacterium HGW-Spirochaetae-10]|nr:MAG: hypothetical protein CVV45_17320 [Spirochaetae bacterium HGW-Spirochaetae-10]
MNAGMRNALYRFALIGLLGLPVACNQYSTETLPMNPVVLLGPPDGQTSYTGIAAIERISGGGHLLRVSAQNSELLFQGYRIYQASSEAAVMALSADAGTDCGTLFTYPVLGIVYTMEASTAPKLTADNLLCSFPINLTPGQYVSIRAVYQAAFGQPATTSLPSNALIVPP